MAFELKLVRAIPASLDGDPVLILDLSKDGAVVEHFLRFEPSERRLSFHWEGEAVDVRCTSHAPVLQDALSDREQKVIFHTRLDFTGEREPLVRALGAYESRVAEAQEANSAGVDRVVEESIDDLGLPLRERRIGYVSCVLRDGTWRRVETRSADQPMYGFTVAAHESEEHLQLLCLAWEEADAEGRRLLQDFAAASIRAEPAGEGD